MAAERPSRATWLLRKVVATGLFDSESLAGELVVTPRQLEQYLADEEPLPLDRRLALALLVIEKVPSLSRAGHQLKAQIIAAIAYESGTTVTHVSAPMKLR